MSSTPVQRARVIERDVIVVGGGGSALAAAIEAASLHRSVALLEKGERLGGTTDRAAGRSVGSISSSNTPHQYRAGILDSPQDHLDDLYRFNAKLGLPNHEVFSRLLELASLRPVLNRPSPPTMRSVRKEDHCEATDGHSGPVRALFNLPI